MLVTLQCTTIYTYGAEASVFNDVISEKKVNVSPGVIHEQTNFQTGSMNQAVNLLDINLNDAYTKMEINVPNPMNLLNYTSTMAKQNNVSGHRVIGATNASFYLGNGSPANLLALNNEIMNFGILGESFESPTQQPYAFGISKTGVAIVDRYSTNLSFTINGKNYPIDQMNNQRSTNRTIVYTPLKSTTGTNEWGTEIIVTNASKSTKNIRFGDRISGVVSRVTKYGVEKNSPIPTDGFVISVQNKELGAELSKIQPGQLLEIQVNIDEKWQDAQFILAAGPLLVKDGKVNISMPTTSTFANLRSPRTAIAVDATGKRVFLVTVDGRQSGYSNGTNLQDLASYLISKGATAAINLDGGGSTTMVVRQPYSFSPILVNRPSNGYERKVSAILQAVSIAPPGTAKTLVLSGAPKGMIVGMSTNLSVASVFDEYMNPITFNPTLATWSVEGGIGRIEGTKFTATTEGTGKLIAELNGVKREAIVHVASISTDLIDSFDNVSTWSAASANAKASIASSSIHEPYRQGKSSLKLVYDFTENVSGTKAAYVVANSPLSIFSYPKHIGVWVAGDGGNGWLRGVVVDGLGAKHTIDFTNQGGMNWTGWKYVTATIPTNLELPLKFERIYMADPSNLNQKKGTIYFDQLQAVYTLNYEENLYKDVTKGHWAYNSINYLNKESLIKGFNDGSFRPDHSITRAEAATIIARELNLKPTQTVSFSDVKSGHYAINNIAAVAEKGIMTGREKGTFQPDVKLSRAEVSTILERAYKLTGTTNTAFTDVKTSHWAYSNIKIMIANNLTTGYPGGTFQPDKAVTRAEFAAFLERVLTK